MTHTSSDWPTILTELAKPFPPDTLHWRVGSISRDQKTAQALPYADTRAYEDHLNHVCGDAWTVTYQPWGDTRIICNLTIDGITRSSTGEQGTSPNDVAGTSAEAQAFKRACSKFGLGRYLYNLPTPWLPYDPQTKRFLQAPTLTTTPRSAARKPHTAKAIGEERATVMAQMLQAHGLTDRQQRALAARVLRRPITDLAALTEDEARSVWKEVQRLQTEQPGHARQRSHQPPRAPQAS